MPEVIHEFSGEYEFLSNFYPCFKDKTVEHLFQAAKAHRDDQRHSILNAASPGKAKKLGRKAELIKGWELQRVDVMRGLLRMKFSNSELRSKLLATGNARLVEGNWWGDTFWGVCKGKGENVLGKLLMEIREEIRNG